MSVSIKTRLKILHTNLEKNKFLLSSAIIGDALESHNALVEACKKAINALKTGREELATRQALNDALALAGEEVKP